MAIWPRRSTHFELETSRQLQQLFEASAINFQRQKRRHSSKHHFKGNRCEPENIHQNRNKQASDVASQGDLMDFMDNETDAWKTQRPRTDSMPPLEPSPMREARTYTPVSYVSMPNYADEESDNEEDELSTASTVPWKRGIRLILPHVGLIMITIIYTVIGAAIFHRIELPNEREMKRSSLDEIYERRLKMIRQLWKVAKEEAADLKDFEELAISSMTNITNILFHSFHKYYLTSHEIAANKTTDEWSFSTAVFFALTVVTTIGFGNPAPATLTGRAVCICFALFGIPLTLVTIADIGKFFSEYLVWQYNHYLNFKDEMKNRFKRWKGRRFGQPPLHDSYLVCEHCKQHRMLNFDQNSVPATVVIAILFGYTALGGLLFCRTEMWDYFEAFYFSFITMTTIGFGDLTPRRGSNMIGILMYIVLGLVITTMCIDLVGVHYIRKIHYFGRKIQDARSALAIVGDKVFFVGEWYNQIMAKRRNDQQRNGFLYPNVYITKHMIPFIPKDIRNIRYIDWSSDSLSSMGSIFEGNSCKYCHNRVCPMVITDKKSKRKRTFFF